MFPSALPVTNTVGLCGVPSYGGKRPSGAHANDVTVPSALKVRSKAPVPVSHMFTMFSPVAAASHFPFGPNDTKSPPPGKLRISSPLDTSQMPILRSFISATSQRPSGLKDKYLNVKRPLILRTKIG